MECECSCSGSSLRFIFLSLMRFKFCSHFVVVVVVVVVVDKLPTLNEWNKDKYIYPYTCFPKRDLESSGTGSDDLQRLILQQKPADL